MIVELGRPIMRAHTRIILLLILLLVGAQWIADPFENGEQSGDQHLTATWNALEQGEPDESHHFALLQVEDEDVILSLSDVAQDGPDMFGWVLPSSDSTSLQNLDLTHRIPRAPPAA